MTSPLRRKRPTTARGPSTPAATAPSPWLAAAAVAVLVAGGAAAQAPRPSPYAMRTTACTWATHPQPQPVAAVPALRPVPKPAPPAVKQVFYQPGGPRAGAADAIFDESQQLYQIQLEPPGLERLAAGVQTDADLQQRIIQETRDRVPTERVVFPESPVLSRDTYRGRGPTWAERRMTVEPNFLVHGRLYFEEKNLERYGWDLGPLSPLYSAAKFYGDVVLFPYKLATDPCRKYESSAGLCLPGDPVPFLFYPPELSLTGAAAEVAVIAALIAIFP